MVWVLCHSQGFFPVLKIEHRASCMLSIHISSLSEYDLHIFSTILICLFHCSLTLLDAMMKYQTKATYGRKGLFWLTLSGDTVLHMKKASVRGSLSHCVCCQEVESWLLVPSLLAPFCSVWGLHLRLTQGIIILLMSKFWNLITQLTFVTCVFWCHSNC